MTTLWRDISISCGGMCAGMCPSTQQINVEFRCFHSVVRRITPISVIADWSCWSVAAAEEKAAFPWTLHPPLLWISIFLLAYAWSWGLASLRTWSISEWLLEKYSYIYFHQKTKKTENNVQSCYNRSLLDMSMRDEWVVTGTFFP